MKGRGTSHEYYGKPSHVVMWPVPLKRILIHVAVNLRRIFGLKRDGVTGEWRKLHTEELNDLYPSPSTVRVIKSRRMRWARHVALVEEGRDVHKVLVGKPEGKRPLGRPRRRWEDNIKMDLQKVGGVWGLNGVGSG